MSHQRAFVPTCTVVICTRDRPADLDRCLEALLPQDYPRFDILVVDNAPSDGRTEEVARRHGVRRVVEPVPGLSRARNRGAAESAGEIIAYLDDDAFADSGWLRGLTAEFSDPRVMAVAGRIVPLGPQAEEGRMCALVTERGLARRSFDRQTPGWFAAANFGGIGIGANMAIRRDAFSCWQGFNPRLGRGGDVPACEENCAFFELIAAGYRVVYTPAAVVRHHTPLNLRELREQHLNTLVEAGAYMAFLLAEKPQYRSATFRFIAGRLKRARRRGNAQSAAPAQRIAPRWREVYAGIRGGLLYARSRWANQAR